MHFFIIYPISFCAENNPDQLVPLERLFDRNDVVVKVKGSTENDNMTE